MRDIISELAVEMNWAGTETGKEFHMGQKGETNPKENQRNVDMCFISSTYDFLVVLSVGSLFVRAVS